VHSRLLERHGSLAVAGALALSLGALGCSGPPPLTTARQGIIAGEPSGKAQDGVLLLRGLLDDGSEFVCSASLVAPNLLATAQHCVSYLTQGLFSCSTRGELIESEDGAGTLGLSLPPERLEVYGGKIPRRTPLARGARIISTHSRNICQNDLAFVVLDTSLSLPVVPLRLGRPAELNEPGVLVGYGMDAGQRSIDYRTQARAQKPNQAIIGVGPDSVEDGVLTVPPRTLRLEGPSGCIGDSGGPLLAQSSGALLGVYSLQVGDDCAAAHVRHQLVHVPPFQLLIEEAFAAAGARPLLETTEEPPSGSAGAGGNEGGGGSDGAADDPPPMESEASTPQSSGCALTQGGCPRDGWALLAACLSWCVRRLAATVQRIRHRGLGLARRG
jgi:hypothetical protein